MHPEIQAERPGMCPECGMDLVKIRNPRLRQSFGGQAKSETRNSNKSLDSARDKPFGHTQGKHAGHSTNMFFRKFWISLILTIPVLLYSDLIKRVFGIQLPGLEIGNWELGILIPAALGSVVFFYGGWVFLAGASREIRGRLPGMMTLIAIAVSAAYLWSIYAVIAGAETLFWELTTLITIMLLGHWLEMRAVKGAQGALKELSKLLPDTAERIIQNAKIKNQNDNVKFENETETVRLEELNTGDLVLVKPGAKVPADGKVIDGESDLNEAMITGESKPVTKKTGDAVIAGTINGDGALKVSVTNIGEKTFLAGVMRLVAEAQASKSRLQILSDRAALYLTFIAVTGGFITLVAWLLAGAEVGFAVARLVAVLVVACPHALGLAVPLVASISTTKAAQNGFLVKQRLALEAARTVDTVLFDKTGTLTRGEFGIMEIWNLGGRSQNEVLELAASLDAFSEHPIAKAIVAEAKARGLRFKEIKNFEAIKGKGAKSTLDGKEVMIGGPALIESQNIVVPSELAGQAEAAGKKGQTVIFVIESGAMIGAVALADVIREESREALRALKAMGVRTAMITGDSEDVASWVSGELGIDEYYARVLPGEKSEIVKRLQNPKHARLAETSRGWEVRNSKQYLNSNDQNSKQFRASSFELRASTTRRVVAMVGDGVNDAPALTQADLGIAIGAGTNVAIESAGIILVRNDPRDIVKIIRLSRMTYSKMIQNLFWATGYNVVAIPLAAGALAFKGILLEPALAAIFMSASTVIVAVNALFLRRQKI